MKAIVRQIFYFLLVVTAMACANIFAGGAKKTLDAARFFDARIKVNNRDWTGAIDTIGLMSTKYKARRDVKFLLASAYAGRCGLDFLAIAQHLKNQGGSQNLFQLLLPVFKGIPADQATKLADCANSELTLAGISSLPSSRTADENILMAFVGMAKATVAISITMDVNGDGISDGANPCTMPNGDAAELITGLTNALYSFESAGGTIGTTYKTLLDAACARLDALSGASEYNICLVTDIATVTANQRQAARALAGEGSGPSTDGFGLKRNVGFASATAIGCGT